MTIPNDNGLPEDSSVNVWHFDGDDGNTDSAYHSAIITMLTTFYQAIDAAILSGHTSSPAVVTLYDIRDAQPRQPEHTNQIVLTPNAAGLLPNEVAICLSYQAPAVSGLPQARRRGRIFIGPVCQASGALSNGEFRLAASSLTIITDAASVLATPLALATVGSMSWSIYSPTTDILSTIDDAFHDVDNGWVDNAYDTQRRRGAGATVRTLWS